MRARHDEYCVNYPDEGHCCEVATVLAALDAERARKCSCDGDPIECSHEAAAGHYQEQARQARAEVEWLRREVADLSAEIIQIREEQRSAP